MTRVIYFVTEGKTDQILLEGLVEAWLASEDFIARHIQPPSSAYASGLDSNLSEGWRGVLAWCRGTRASGEAGRDEALRLADCLFIHMDSDVARETDFCPTPFTGPCPPASNACDWVRCHLIDALGGSLPSNAVLCIPSQDLEAWVLSALHPDIADQHAPIECREQPGALLIQRPPHRLVRRKDGALKKDADKYRNSLNAIVAGWVHCAGGENPRCPEAARFEGEARKTLLGAGAPPG